MFSIIENRVNAIEEKVSEIDRRVREKIKQLEQTVESKHQSFANWITYLQTKLETTLNNMI